MASKPLRVGILGVGMIATVRTGVIPNLHHIADKVEPVAVADPVVERAREAAKTYGIPEVYASLDEMLDGADIEAVVNLTPIPVHGETSLRIVGAGKHLVVEKPLATTMEAADAVIETAAAQGVTMVCSPPDLLYPAHREAARLIGEGVIGKVAFVRSRRSHAGPGGGQQGWPNDPSWFYREGSGPLFDLGVYGIHEITGLLGPAKRVVGFCGVTEPTRTVRGGPYAGTVMEVTADDNCLLMLDFGEATFAVVDSTYNVQAATSPRLEIFGRKGAINVHDRNSPTPLEVYRNDALPGVDGWVRGADWAQVREQSVRRLGRAVLVDHLADCVRDGTRPVLSAEHARHALEIMIKVTESARQGTVLDLTTTF